MEKSRHNIVRLYIIKIAKWFTLIMPIIVLFFQDNGLEMTDIMLLKSIYSIAVVLLEIPSGYCADSWGRRNSLILGAIMGTVGMGLYACSYNFIGLIFAEIVLGIGHSLISGADSAILYDTLKEAGREDEYVKYEGRIISSGNVAEAIAGVIGGVLATVSLRLPFICQTVIASVAIPAAYTLIEPSHFISKKRSSFRDILGAVRYVVVDNIQLRWNVHYSSVIGCATLTMAWFAQPIFKELDISVTMFGVMWTVLNLAAALFSMQAYRIERILGDVKTLILIAVGVGAGYIIVGSSMNYLSIAVLLLFYMIRGVATPVLKEYTNRVTPSDIRATVLSVRNFTIRLLFAFIAPAMGYITDSISLGVALLCGGVVVLIFSTLCILGVVLNRDNS